MRLLFMLSLLTLLLANGCNRPASSSSEAAGQDAGGTETGQGGQPDSTDIPATWPDWFPRYPDSEIVSAKGIFDDLGQGLEAELVTGDSPQNIIDFYHERVVATGAYLRNSRVSPDRLINSYIGPIHDITVDATQLAGSTRIFLLLQPTVPWEGEYPPLMVEWNQLEALPPGFPTDLLPLMPEATINTGIVAGEKFAVLDCLLSCPIADAVAFYSLHLSALGWSESVLSQTETAYNVIYKKDDLNITVGIGQYADGQVFASLNLAPQQ